MHRVGATSLPSAWPPPRPCAVHAGQQGARLVLRAGGKDGGGGGHAARVTPGSPASCAAHPHPVLPVHCLPACINAVTCATVTPLRGMQHPWRRPQLSRGSADTWAVVASARAGVRRASCAPLRVTRNAPATGTAGAHPSAAPQVRRPGPAALPSCPACTRAHCLGGYNCGSSPGRAASSASQRELCQGLRDVVGAARVNGGGTKRDG